MSDPSSDTPTSPTDMPRRILITGANKSLGYEAARALIAAGHEVWIGARDPQRGATAAAQLGGRFVQIDVLDDASVHTARETIAAAGGLDVLVNNAGILGPVGPVAETTADAVREVFETNVFGVVRVTQVFLPLLEASEAPVVVNVSSGMGSLGRTTDPERIESSIVGLPYPSSKSALNMVTSQYSKAFPSMRINAVDPGYTATDFNAHSGPQSVEEGPRSSFARPSSAPTARPAPTSTARASSPGDLARARQPGPKAAGRLGRVALAAADRGQRALDPEVAQRHRDQPAGGEVGFERQLGDQREAARRERALHPFETRQGEVWVQLDSHCGERRGGHGAGSGAGLARDPAAAGKLPRVDRAAARPAVPGGDDEDDPVAGDDLRLQPVERIEALDEADVGAALPDRLDRPRRVDHVDLRVDAGELGAEGGQPGRQERLADRVAAGDPQRPRGAVADDRLLGQRQRVEPAPRLRIERHPLVGRADAVAAAVEQRRAEPALERLDPLGRRRLGQVERFGGALDAARLDRGEEGGELTGGDRIGHSEKEY
jgi:NAD(P)-dependent dehydrogenase (short-subunit alcohol dehydrogenase family)